MREVGNLKRIGDEYSKQDAGTLSIATTHTQARYVLPEPVAALRKRFPKVNVSLHQGTPDQVAQMVLEEVADIGLATESLSGYAELVTLPCYEWQHVVVMPAGHAAGAARAHLARRPGDRAADLLPPVVHRPHAHRPGLRRAAAQAQRGARGDRLRRHQDLCAARPRRGHRRRDGGARRPAGRRPGVAPARPPVRPERGARRLQARRLPAQLRLRVRRADLEPPEPRADRARDERRRRPTTSSEHHERRLMPAFDAGRREPPAAGRHDDLHA